MRYYAHFGHTEFVLCLGYGAHHIKDYFLHYDETASNDFVLRGGDVELLGSDIRDWTITFVHTGLDLADRRAAAAGARARRGRGDVPRQLRRRPHRHAARRHARPVPRAARQGRGAARGAAAVGVPLPRRRRRRHDPLDQHPRSRCRSGRTAATSSSGRRSSTSSRRTAIWSSDGAMVLAKEGRMMAYPYRGFWQPADTVKERTALEAAYQGGTRPWMLWDRSAGRAHPPAGHDRGHAQQPARALMLSLLPERLDRLVLARRALRRHRDRRGRLAAGAVPRPTPASRSRRWCSPAAARCARRRNGPRSPRSARAPGCDIAVLDLPDGRVPTRWERAKGALEELRGAGEPDLILAPHRARRPPGPPHARQARAHGRSATTSRWATRSSSGSPTSPSPPSSCRWPSR